MSRVTPARREARCAARSAAPSAPRAARARASRPPRGTPLDDFGYAKVRRVERALIGEYRALVERSVAELTPETQPTVVKIAALPDIVRGYEDIKLRNVERFHSEARRLLGSA